MAVQDSLLSCLLLKIDQEELNIAQGCIYSSVVQISDSESWWFLGGWVEGCEKGLGGGGSVGSVVISVDQLLSFLKRVHVVKDFKWGFLPLCFVRVFLFCLFASLCFSADFEEQVFIVMIFIYSLKVNIWVYVMISG